MSSLQSDSKSLASDEPELESQLLGIIDELSAAAPSVSCSWDGTLLNHSYPLLLRTNFMLAANFKDNALIMPQVMNQANSSCAD